MTWTTNKILLNHNENTPCNDIFQAACDEIGAYYVREKGFKYTPSRPKLVLQKGDIKLEIAFFSTRTNVQGKWVTLQIMPQIFAKSAKNAENPKGILLGYPDIFYHPTDEMPPKMTIHHIYGEVEYNTESWITESVIRDYHACELYGLTEEKFSKILGFIDGKIMERFNALTIKKQGKLDYFELCALGQKIAKSEGTEAEINQWMIDFDLSVPYPKGSSLFFYPENYNARRDDISKYNPKVEEIVQKCLYFEATAL
jgi:hypothetical protein